MVDNVFFSNNVDNVLTLLPILQQYRRKIVKYYSLTSLRTKSNQDYMDY